MTNDRLDEIACAAFERHNGRPHPWEGALPWVIAAMRDAATTALLAPDHRSMKVDSSGLFRQACAALKHGGKEPGLAELLRQLQDHLTELGQRWYAGDATVVDEFLQLYCIAPSGRAALKLKESVNAS